jgi:hypothetical protein
MGLLNGASELAFLGPMLVFGVLVDRMRRKPLMIGTDLGRAALIAGVPILAWTGTLGNARALRRVAHGQVDLPGGGVTSPRITASLTAGGATIAALARCVVVIAAAERSGIPDHRPARQRPGPPADTCPGPITFATSADCHASIRDQRDQCRPHHRARATASGHQQEMSHRPQLSARSRIGSSP